MSVSLEKAGIWSNIGQHEEDTEVYDVCQPVWSNIGQHMAKTLRSMIKFTIALLYSTIISLPY